MRNRFGFQTQSGTPPDFDKIDFTRIAAWLCYGEGLNLGMARQVRTKNPHTAILMRYPFGNWALDVQWTRDYANELVRFIRNNWDLDCVDAVLAPNEPPVSSLNEVKLLNDCQVVFSDIIHASLSNKAGQPMPVVAYNISVGQPPFELVQYLAEGARHSEYIGLHCYGSTPPDHRMQTSAEFYALRYRLFNNLLPVDARRPFILTETGIDTGKGGYKSPTAISAGINATVLIDGLKWQQSRAEEDGLVAAVTIFGAGMTGNDIQWKSFDVLDVEADRMQFMSFVSGLPVVTEEISPNLALPIVPPVEGDMPTPSEIVAMVPFLVKRAIQLDLGPSIYGQYEVRDVNNNLYLAWIFQRGGVIVKDGDFLSLDNVRLFNPQTGALMDKPLPWPCQGVQPIPPSPVKRLTTADMPPEYGIIVQSYIPTPGQKFFGLVGASNFKSGPNAGTGTVLVAVNEQGSPVIGFNLTHAWDDNLHKSETFPSPSFGAILSTGSYYNPPAMGPDHFYVSKGPSPEGVWPMPYPSDIVIGGMPNGQHFEAQYTWQLMTG